MFFISQISLTMFCWRWWKTVNSINYQDHCIHFQVGKNHQTKYCLKHLNTCTSRLKFIHNVKKVSNSTYMYIHVFWKILEIQCAFESFCHWMSDFLTWCNISNNPIILFNRPYFSKMRRHCDAMRLNIRKNQDTLILIHLHNDYIVQIIQQCMT